MLELNYLVKSESYLAFRRQIEKVSSVYRISHNMIGFNYSQTQIYSIKFYFVFYTDMFSLDKVEFPIKELKDEFLKYYSMRDERYINNKDVLGGGLTFTIKYDSQGNITKGVYFRIMDENIELIENIKQVYTEFDFSKNDFENGYGKYMLVSEDVKEEKEYLYLLDSSKLSGFGERVGINLGKSDSVEISNSVMSDSKYHKIVSFGKMKELNFNRGFYDKMPEKLKKILDGSTDNLYCPAAYLKNEMYSIYWSFSGLSNSF